MDTEQRTIENTGISPVAAFWKRRRTLVPLVLLVGIGAGYLGYSSGGTTTVEMGVYLTDPRGVPTFRDGSSAPADLASHASQRADFARSTNVLTPVSNQLDIELGELRSSIEVVPATNGSFAIFCRDDDAERAQAICQRVVAVYQQRSLRETERRAEVTIEALEADRVRLLDNGDGEASAAAIDQIDITIADTRATAALFGSGVEFIEERAPQSGSKIRPAIQLGVAGMAFALLVLGVLAWWRSTRRPVVASAEQSADLLAGTLVGSVRANNPGDYEMIATSLEAAGLPRLISVLRPQPSRDRDPMVAFDLATTMARSNRRVLLIDGDVVGRRLSRRFGRADADGLIEVMRGASSVDDVIVGVRNEQGVAITLLSSGRAVEPAASLFRSDAAERVFAELSLRYDVVIVDTPSVVTSAEGAALTASADGALVIVSSHSLLSDIDSTRRRMDLLKTPVLGVIFERTAR